ncbi:MAG: hypothetical protein HY819_11615 [Acidobacteria bacterium]|nr:hypothetical protein [Acidobacteriota bacterium]
MGTFESHITIQLNNQTALSLFRSVCEELKVKCSLIELPNGINRFQPMTSLYHQGSFESVLKEVNGLAQSLTQEGFKVIRVKIEALINNLNVPITDEQAKKFPNNYFEFHLLVTLSSEKDKERLKNLCTQNNAHLSQNAFKKTLYGLNQHFVTMRLYNIGKTNAKAEFSKLIEMLKKENFSLSNKLQEYIVYDSNISLDQGWVEPVC